ncbi:hypothetical protein ASE37_23590 [Rhizobium sp. Root268]|nr:hypothetical protein ASC86_22545 [Rhizobium sp. Root1212]KRD31726.1 hypothetical protein ASE37_23590 [Rhizobium sp. Root268]
MQRHSFDPHSESGFGFPFVLIAMLMLGITFSLVAFNSPPRQTVVYVPESGSIACAAVAESQHRTGKPCL